MSVLIKAVEIAKHTLGTLSFFHAVRTDRVLLRQPGQAYWSWPQWDRFFELAEEHGMNACQQHENGKKTVTLLHFSSLGTSLLMDWRRVQDAKRSGQSAYGFHMQEERRRAAEKEHLDAMEQYQQTRVANERKAQNEMFSASSQKAKTTTYI